MKHLLSSALLGAALLAAPAAAAEPSGAVVYAEPLGTAVFASDGGLYLPIGVLVPLGELTHLTIEVTPTVAGWHPCGSESAGAFAKLGLRQGFGPGASAHQGWFVQPRVGARYLSTSGGHADNWFGCSADGVASVQGDELELSVGADLGYQWTFGSFYVAPVFGLSAGYCHECVGGSQPVGFDLGIWPEPQPRTDRMVLGVNLNLLQVGLAF